VRERTVLQVGDDLLDDRVRAVGGLGSQRWQQRLSVNTAW